jgi:hypothetical protein
VEYLEDIMKEGMTRREFLGASAAGALGIAAGSGLVRTARASEGAIPKWATSKVRVGKVYIGGGGGWPSPIIDAKDDLKQIEGELAKLKPQLPDVEFVEGGHVTSAGQMKEVKAKFRDVDGIVIIPLSMFIVPYIKDILTLAVPTVFFTLPYMGHDWITMPALYAQGKKVERLATSDFNDLVLAIRAFRAIHHLKRAKILSFRNGDLELDYAKGIKDRFGTEIKFMPRARLIEAYNAVDAKLAEAEADRWMKEAEKIIEPTREDILKGSRLYFAMKKILEEEKAHLITIRYCMGIPGLAGAYPCLGFSRLNGEGLGGICEGDLPCSVTYLMFQYLTPQRKPGFVSDPIIDTSNDTIIHAHCMCAIKMDGPEGEQCPYIIRNQQEGQRGACLQVKMRVGQDITMAKLVGDDTMLVSTGKITEVPDVNRACRTKITTKVANVRKIADNWYYGLHRIIFYGDHLDDMVRLSRFLGFKVIHEGVDEVSPPPEQVERDTNIYASYPI